LGAKSGEFRSNKSVDVRNLVDFVEKSLFLIHLIFDLYIHLMKNLIDAIQEAVVKLENGNLNQLELEALTVDARELYERLVVLRYKAYEQRIHLGVSTPESVQVTGNELAEVDLVTEEHHTAPVVPEGGFDFAVFDNEATDDTAVDFTNPVVESPQSQPVLEPVEQATIAVDFAEPLHEIPSVDDVFELSPTEDEVVEPIVEEESPVAEVEETTIAEAFDDSDFEQLTEVEEVKNESPTSTMFFQETITTVVQQQTTVEIPNANGEAHPLTNKVVKSIQSVRSSYTLVPLDTLVGSFSLNEKLQFINELFNGHSESFSNAIKKLDAVGSMSQARQVIAGIAENQNWDFDSETTDEFIAKVCRRYATSLDN
jgi:hypothetical protein